ncbi:hypothetical protein MJ575_14675 [Klebsiella pneumoniae]|nr:hypothetical protein MJ575_14675 [Klebsiella pneumoniae]
MSPAGVAQLPYDPAGSDTRAAAHDESYADTSWVQQGLLRPHRAADSFRLFAAMLRAMMCWPTGAEVVKPTASPAAYRRGAVQGGWNRPKTSSTGRMVCVELKK